VAEPVRLIVGLGNPGREYEDTRHNAGVWYVDALARRQGVFLSEDKKYFGLTGTFTFEGETIRLLVPTTFMNRSGQATAALANFFKIPVTQMLVAHDELDLPPGCARFKQSGGHGGHNGLRDIISKHGNSRDFYRLRIGIGHPGSADRPGRSRPDRPRHRRSGLSHRRHAAWGFERGNEPAQRVQGLKAGTSCKQRVSNTANPHLPRSSLLVTRDS
jgi:PTH1 family peptidyl-tRNA hydrolase